MAVMLFSIFLYLLVQCPPSHQTCSRPVFMNPYAIIIEPEQSTYSNYEALELSCEEQHTPVGMPNGFLYCFPDGSWDPDPSYSLCYAQCNTTELIGDDDIVAIDEHDDQRTIFNHGENVNFACRNKGQFTGSGSGICDNSTLFFSAEPSCLAYCSLVPGELGEGLYYDTADDPVITENTTLYYGDGDRIRYGCLDEFDGPLNCISEDCTSTCDDGSWNPPGNPTCSDLVITTVGLSPSTTESFNRTDLTCDSVSMTLIMDRALLEIDDNARDVHFVDESCVGYDHDSQHIAITTMYNRCGTKQEQDEDNVIFTNKVTFYKPSPEKGTIITREHDLHIPVTCNLKRTQILGESFLPKTEQYVFHEEGYGKFSLRMERYNSSNFQTPANDSGRVTLGTPLYFGIHLASVTNLALLIESCWATGSSDLMDNHRYDIIENGCAVDSTTYIYEGFPATFKTFTIAAFAFIGEYDRVYVHCSILICDNKDSGSRCTQGCLSRSRRSLQPAGYRSKPHTITSGPLSDASRSSRAMLLDTADDGPEYHDPLMIVSVSALCVLFSLTVIMALVIVRMRRHRRPELIGYQRVDTTE